MFFLGKFGPKNQNCHFMLKFSTYTNSNMQNSLMLFSFFVFECKSLFWANLVQNIKILTLCWHLVPRLIQICRIQWGYSLFLFSSANGFLGAYLVQKVKIVTLCWNLVPTLILACRIQSCYSLFLFLSENTLFGQICSKT